MEDNKIDLSIVIPAYNAEYYIKDCINSILTNEKINYEIIIVNDCSSDSTSKIVTDIKHYDKRIKLINNNYNLGVSASRNIGIQNSTGKFITFVDADDFLLDGIYDKLCFNMSDKNDIIVFNYCERKEGKIYNSKYHMKSGVIDSDSGIKLALKDKLPLSSWVYIINRDLIQKKQLYFNPEIKIAEDSLFILELINAADSMFVSEMVGYIYNQNDSSAMHKLNNNIFQLNSIYKYFSKELTNHLKSMPYELAFFESLCNIKTIHAISNSSVKEKKMYLKKVYDRQKLHYILKCSDFPLYVRIETLLLIVLGINGHLLFYPTYIVLKKIIRRN